PLSYFKSNKNGKKDSLQDLFKSIEYGDLIVKREVGSSSHSIVLTEAKTNKFNLVLKKLLEIKTIDAISERPLESVYDKLLKEVLKNEKYTTKEIYSLIFASAVLCYFYDCSLTYFVSTARVANSKRYTLGAMGIGLKAGNELTDNDKALYSILVNHLAANLSTQLIFESNKHLQRENNKVNLREALNEFKKLENKVLHGEEATNKHNFDTEFQKIYNEHSTILTEYFINSYKSLKDVNCNYISKYCLVQLINSGDCGKCNIKERPKLFKNNSGEKCCSSIGNMELINLPFIEALFQKLTTSEKNNIVTVEDAKITDDNEIVFRINYSEGFKVNEFVEKLKESHNGNLIGEFFIKKYHALDCHGIFKMIDVSSDTEFFNSRETIQAVNLNECKIIINEHYESPNIQSVNKIKIVFINEL
ncbi:MAG TPA: hypothetical protein VK590_11935, partial [Saprospiraceae bacterium]|nr:hypothetical protein [Saprospiraceae bacterium]